jgi:hypothetical protein
MALDGKLKQRLTRVLATLDDTAQTGPRLTADALRLWKRLKHFGDLGLLTPQTDLDALELACYALQLPARQERTGVTGKLGRTNVRERCEQGAELLVSLMAADVDEPLLDRTTRLLHEAPQRSPMVDDARLLADALNLDDFGVGGMFVLATQMALHGEGVATLSDAMHKREQYGYWDARLKDGFHHDPIRQIAKRRLETALGVAKLLAEELAEDQGTGK